MQERRELQGRVDEQSCEVILRCFFTTKKLVAMMPLSIFF
jgi:hypothetical protein